jgi:hypothetical protein
LRLPDLRADGRREKKIGQIGVELRAAPAGDDLVRPPDRERGLYRR